MATEKSVMAVIRAARPTFRNAHDKMVFVVHASFLVSGFVLHATGRPVFCIDTYTSTSTDEVGIDNWNESEKEYDFMYLDPDNGFKKALVKCFAIKNKLTVTGFCPGSSEPPVYCHINVPEYDTGYNGPNYGSMYKNLERLVDEIDKEILSKLYGTSTASSSTQASRIVYPPPPLPLYGMSDLDLFPRPGAVRPYFGVGRGMDIGPHNPPPLPEGLQWLVPPGPHYCFCGWPCVQPAIPRFGPIQFNRNPMRPWR